MPAESIFRVGTGLQIFGPISNANISTDEPKALQCSVIDKSSANATSKAKFHVRNVEYKDLQDLTAIRFFGLTAEQFANKIDTIDQSYLDKFTSALRIALGNADLYVVTLKNYVASNDGLSPDQIPDYDPKTQFGTDLYFYAINDGDYISSREIYNTIFNNFNQLQATLGNDFKMKILFDECPEIADFCPKDSRCKQSFLISQNPLTVDANATAIVGMDNKLSTECYCSQGQNNQRICYNGGTVVPSDGTSLGLDYYCQCPDGYEGPRCEKLSIQFRFSASSPSHSYALFEKFALCDPLRVEFEFATERSKGLLLFNGPINRDSSYFIAVEIVDKTLLIHIGYTNISFPNVVVSDKKWHRVDISMSLDAVQVTLDKCQSKTAIISNYNEMLANKQSGDDVQLSLGGKFLAL